MIRHQILSVRMSTRLVLRIGCFVFGCLFRAVTMQGESLRFAFVLTWKRTQTTQTRAFRPQQRVALASPRLASCSRSRFGVAHRVYQYHSDHKAAAVCENRRLEAITRPQGVWVQPAVRRERLVAAAEGCVCAVCVLFPNTLKAEPVPSLFISQHIQYYNQRRESRQEKPLLSLTRFFCLLLSPPKRRKPT